jgi:DNA repair protein RadC
MRKIASSRDVEAICIEFAKKYMLVQEFFGVLCLNQRHEPIGFAVISVGGLASAAVDPRIALKAPLLAGAAAFITTHNHPSGDPTPSAEDIELTMRLSEGARAIGLRLLDHVIVAEKNGGVISSFSMADAGMISVSGVVR